MTTKRALGYIIHIALRTLLCLIMFRALAQSSPVTPGLVLGMVLLSLAFTIKQMEKKRRV